MKSLFLLLGAFSGEEARGGGEGVRRGEEIFLEGVLSIISGLRS